MNDLRQALEQRIAEWDDMMDNRLDLANALFKHGASKTIELVTIYPQLVGMRDELVQIYQDFTTKAINKLREAADDTGDVYQAQAQLLQVPSTTDVYGQHRKLIDSWIMRGTRILFLGHSQGSLFANHAYRYAAMRLGDKAVGIVYVAPAAVQLHGEHTLADRDIVINGLRGRVANWPVADNTTTIPNYLVRKPGVNGKTDWSGHGLLEIYLNQHLDTSTRIRQHMDTAISVLEGSRTFRPAIRVMLTWRGPKPWDLTVTEPTGQVVNAQNPRGVSGFIVETPPPFSSETYVACRASKWQSGALYAGAYQIWAHRGLQHPTNQGVFTSYSALDQVLWQRTFSIPANSGHNAFFLRSEYMRGVPPGTPFPLFTDPLAGASD